jgi:hypothetical protein
MEWPPELLPQLQVISQAYQAMIIGNHLHLIVYVVMSIWRDNQSSSVSNVLDRSNRRKFDEIFDIPRL